ncbi:MAG: phosphoglycerate mutase [Comamonadaceae bacterium]
MHLLIPFAQCSSEGCAAALRSLKLPHLEKLLSRMKPESLDSGDEFSLSPPHERALARAVGLPVADGQIAWAAAQARPAGAAWGFVTPCHWRAGAGQVAMGGATLPDFSEQESQTLLAAMRPYFEEDGITLHYREPNCWLAQSELFEGLATASLDRVVGRSIERWMPRGASATRLQRLQAEMQMLLYTHPVNDARSARGVPEVNSFWLSGTGALPPAAGEPVGTTSPLVVSSLRDAALREDWAAWAHAWATLDGTNCVALLQALDQGGASQLTLCGERNAQTFCASPTSLLTRLLGLSSTARASTALEKL